MTSASNAAVAVNWTRSRRASCRPPHAALQPAAAMPKGRRLTQIDGVLLSGGCHACRMRASNSRAKYAHNCGRQRRTCTLWQFYHGCSVALGISNEPMTVPTPLTREERLAKRAALKAWEDYAEVVGIVAPPAPPRRKVGAPCSDSDSDSDETRSEPDEAGQQHDTVPEDEGEPPPPTEGDESEEDIEAHRPAPAPPVVGQQPRSLLTGRFGARNTMDPQLLGSRYRVV